MIFDIFKTKKQVNIIEQIHTEFRTEVDRLSHYASTKTLDKKLKEKAETLENLGFKKAKGVKENEIQKKDNFEKTKLEEAIAHFNFYYPQNKFITEDSVKKICKKYGLILGTVDKYIGEVPDDKLKEIANFKVREEDVYGFFTKFEYGYSEKIIPKDMEEFNFYKNKHSIFYYKDPLHIVAPVSEFDTSNMKVEDYNLVEDIKDPIVLQPVKFKGNKYFLIVAMWGLEAQDESLQNSALN